MSTEPSLVVALEGGGSKTVAVAVDRSGQAVAWGRSGSSLALYIPHEEALAAVDEALDIMSAHVDPQEVGVVAMAMVGCGYSADPEGPLARRFPRARAVSVSEADAALFGATFSEHGAVAMSGTGSFGHAAGRQGRTGHTGGHGPLVGDEGSGHWIALEAIRRAFWALDGRGEATVLGERICAHYGLRRLWDVIGRLYQAPKLSRHETASLAPVVAQAAREGDAVARLVLEGAAEHLARMAVAAIRQVRQAGDGWEGAIPFSCTGGVGLGSPLLREAVIRAVAAQVPEISPVGPYLSPVGGVAVSALRELGVAVEGEVASRLRDTFPSELGKPVLA